MSDDLEERIRSNAAAFDGLLSLIPADLYYGKDDKDKEDQWNKKKQTKEQAQAAKKAKLDPDSIKSAVDVRKEKNDAANGVAGKDEEEGEVLVLTKKQLKKLKRKLRDETGEDPMLNGPKPEKKAKVVKEGEEKGDAATPKKPQPKTKTKTAQVNGTPAVNGTLVQPTPKKEKKDKKKDQKPTTSEIPNGVSKTPSKAEKGKPNGVPKADTEPADDEWESEAEIDADISMDSIAESEPNSPSTSTSKSAPAEDSTKPTQSTENTAISTPSSSRASSVNVPDVRARLQAKIEAFRAARKAVKEDGTPRSRQEFLEARRKKEELRRERKKAMRLKQKEDEKEHKAGESLTKAEKIAQSDAPTVEVPNNFAFGKVIFDDGIKADAAGLDRIKKKKGPSDPFTALKALEHKKQRIENMTAEKKETIEEKELWSKAIKQTMGEKVTDNEKMLKKTLKRQQQQKNKSSKEWGDRKENVQKGIENRQKKREENLQKRREEKGVKGKKAKTALKKKQSAAKKANRPGFEGGFKGGKGKK